MVREALAVCWLFLPLLLGLVFHGFCLKFHWLPQLNRPVDASVRLRGKPIFGANKTYRGLLTVGIGTSAGFWLQAHVFSSLPSFHRIELLDYSQVPSLSLGFAVGVAAMLSELPNSFVKRRLGIASGSPADGVLGPVFYVLDQVDMLFGSWLVLAWFVPVSWQHVAASVIFLFLSHQVITRAGYALGMRATAR